MVTYAQLYLAAKIRPEKLAECNLIATRISQGKPRYDAVAAKLGNGIPWWFIGITHFMEAGHKFPNQFNFHLHCGDPLTAKTIHIPKGRPKHDPAAGKGKPYTWEESALDALIYMKYDKETNWDIERCLYLFEKFNGFGYIKRNIYSPYLWSYTNHYTKGKFEFDGKFNPNLVSKQPGTAAIMKALKVFS